MKIQNFAFLMTCFLFIEAEFVDSLQLLRHRRETDNIPVPSRCLEPPDSGMCLAYFLNYFYNSSKGKCETFVYGGCGGNDNNFWSLHDCETVCEGSVLNNGGEENEFKSIIESLQALVESKDDCEYPPETGVCRASIPRYYFNGDKCEIFIYGGCGANPNNFQTEEECITRCILNSENGSEENEIRK